MKRQAVRIRYHRTDGDAREPLAELLQERLKAALAARGVAMPDDLTPLLKPLLSGGEAGASGDLRSRVDGESVAEG